MAKHFNDMLTEMNCKASPWAKSPADNAFIGLHGVETTPDANGNADPVFKGTVKKDGTRAADARGRKLFDQMQKDLKIAAGGKDADGDTDGDVVKEEINWDHVKAGDAGISSPKSKSDTHVTVHYYPNIKGSNEKKVVQIPHSEFKKHVGSYRSIEESIDSIEEDVKDIDYARRLFHEAMGRHHDQNAFKCRERGDHAQAKKFDRMSEESFEKATKGAPIKEETESYEEVLAEAESFYNDKNAPFQTGDHVHHISDTGGRYHFSKTINKHGVVASHDGRTAKVHWEDGTKSSHHQTSGKHAGKVPDHLSKFSEHKIRHNTVHVADDNGHLRTNRVSNDEHKASLQAHREAKAAAYAHESSHQDAQHKLSNMHHSTMKPHHLKALHDLLNRAQNGED